VNSQTEIGPTGINRGLPSFTLLRQDIHTGGMHLDWLRCAERLSAADCDELIDACSEFPLTPPTTVGEDRYPARRQADTRKVGMNSRTKWIFDLLASVAHQSTQNAFGLDLTAINRAPQYVEYRPGWGRFDWHNDYSHGVADAPRKLTIITQLSSADEYDGGSLDVFGPEIEELPKERGTVVVFPALLYHRVTPVTRGIRRALVAWVAGPRIR
jgi:PKHD-type hydroxylase